MDGHFAAVQRLHDGIKELEGLLFAAGRRETEAVRQVPKAGKYLVTPGFSGR
ncbi:hypothetical protein [Streptomyces sp. 142MFCol3.1]|uniref:hypothetical protein n=1 Tax=Streptomyces sp. 142MFCol3.1 TaxID=1172179 RepID=UPI0004041E9B|nr:hypothetical protein [Streptomyces sp. 142MFCol3.1]